MAKPLDISRQTTHLAELNHSVAWEQNLTLKMYTFISLYQFFLASIPRGMNNNMSKVLVT
jgi:hypothetical protein